MTSNFLLKSSEEKQLSAKEADIGRKAFIKNEL